MTIPLLRGFRGFSVMWLGQFVSLVGTGMTRFAITIWAYEQTQSASVLATVGFCAFAPTILMTPVAGALVDRWNRKRVMLFSDLAAGLSTLLLLILFQAGSLEIGHLYLAAAIGGTFESFQFPAYSAAITMMLNKAQYGRAAGMQALGHAASTVVAPIAAATLLALIGLGGVMMLDLLSFLLAFVTLQLVHIPQPISQASTTAKPSLLRESLFGFQYIRARPSLLGMQTLFFFANLFGAIGFVLLPALILARTGMDKGILASVEAMVGVGGVAGGILMSVWGGPQRRAYGVFIGMALGGLPLVLMGMGQNLWVWAAGGFLMTLCFPLLNGSNQALWQSKVPPELQGKVFSARRLIAQVTAPVAMLAYGFLADKVFEPAMMPGGTLTDEFAWLVGTGAGAGMGLLFIASGILGTLTGLAGFLLPFIRNIEDILPDAEVIAQADAAPADAPLEGSLPSPAEAAASAD